jgi:hypothetical protein
VAIGLGKAEDSEGRKKEKNKIFFIFIVLKSF